MEDDPFQLRICTLDGQSTTVMVKPQDTIGGLKHLIQEKKQFPLQFHLFLRGQKLNVGDSIQTLALRDGEFMVMIPYTKKKQTNMVSTQKDISYGGDYSAETSGYAQVSVNVGSEAQCNCIARKSGGTISLKDATVSENVDSEVQCNSIARKPGGTISPKDASVSENVASEVQCNSIARKPGETISLKDATVIDNASGCQENLSRQTDHVVKASMDASDSVWNTIVADMSAWKASMGAVASADTRSNQAEEYREHMDTFVDASVPSCSKSGAQKRRNCRKERLDWKGFESIIQETGAVRETVTSAQNSVEEKQVNVSIDEGCFSGVVGDSTDISYRQKRARKFWSCPTVLKRQYELFRALNSVYGFLQRQHMQGTWQNMKSAVQKLCEGHWEEIQASDLEDLAILFPKLVHLSSRIGEGPDSSCNITLLEPSKVPDQSMPRSLHEVMPRELQKEIGPSDLLPSAGGKQISDSLIKRSIQKRQRAFETAVDKLMKQLQESMKGELKEVALDDLLCFAKQFPKYSSNMALPRPPRQHKKFIRCMDTTDFSASEMFEHLQQGLGSLGQIVHCEIIEPREAKYGELVVTLSDHTMAALGRLSISKLYIHQTEAINAAVSKQNVIVSTSTASGKSVCYNIPVLDDLFRNAESCSLYLFPTKALAQDQLRALLEMTSGLEPSISMGVYDGDTPQHQRLYFRDHARLIITNPDMLHVSILPSHKQFEHFLSNLRYVVIDEAHAYRGAFGCHSAVILRRLRRLCYHLYGTQPTFIVSSATVANPREHAMELIGLRSIQVVQEDGSPCERKYFILWNPPVYYSTRTPSKVQNNQETSKKQLHCKRSSPIVEVASLLTEMVQHNLRCISFCKTRKLCELVLRYTCETLKETAPDLVNTIRSYRAGYTAQDRRLIECDLFGGRLRAVAATNALELGVDVGSLDATLHLGFPGTVASLWQQAGRAGRREKPSLSIYVAFDSPLDQHFMKHPKKLFSRAIEHAQIDAFNPQVLEEQIVCAAVEHPLNLKYDEFFFGSGLQTIISRLVNKGQIGRNVNRPSLDDTWNYIGKENFPAQSVSIRAIDPEKYTIINQVTNETIEEVEESKAFFEVYEGAVYFHQGRTYLVKILDLAAKVAICQEADVKYYTKTRDFTDVHVIGGDLAYPRKVLDNKFPTTTAQASLCKVTTKWIGFRRIWQGTNQTFDSVDLFLPDYSYESQAAWIRVPHTIREVVENTGIPFRAGLHAASHALLNIMPLYILCNVSDLGTECANPHDTRYFPERLLIFDRHPGGIGISAQAQPLFAELLQAALELLVSCDCTVDVGCPNCIQYLACSEYNEVLNKHAAIVILQGVIDAEESYRKGKDDKTHEDA